MRGGHAAVLAALLLGCLSFDAAAQDARTFDAVASADGVRVLVVQPGAPLTSTVVDAGGPTAQARLGSTGASTGFAAEPDPGTTVLGAPSTAGTSDVAYPLFVASSYPAEPSRQVDAGAYVLSAVSRERSSTASARSGTSAPAATTGSAAAAAAVTQESDLVRAEASVEDVGLALGPLSVGRLRARARVEQTAGRAAVRTSSLDVEGLSVGGSSVGVGPRGLTVAGTTTPLPDTSPARRVLAAAGASVHYLEPTQTPNGVTSAGLSVTLAGPGGQQTQYLLGRVVARVATSGGAAAPAVAAPAPPLPADLPEQDDAPATAAAPGPGGEAEAPVEAPAPPAPQEPAAPEPLPAVAATDPAAELDVAVQARALRRPDPWPRSFFLVLVGGGLVAVLAASLFSTLGVRHP